VHALPGSAERKYALPGSAERKLHCPPRLSQTHAPSGSAERNGAFAIGSHARFGSAKAKNLHWPDSQSASKE
jgi:hypothetical protein